MDPDLYTVGWSYWYDLIMPQLAFIGRWITPCCDLLMGS